MQIRSGFWTVLGCALGLFGMSCSDDEEAPTGGGGASNAASQSQSSAGPGSQAGSGGEGGSAGDGGAGGAGGSTGSGCEPRTTGTGGGCVWSEGFGDLGYQIPWAVAVDDCDHVLVTGSFEGTLDFGGAPLSSLTGDAVFVAKRDASGQHIWSKQFGSTWSGGTAIGADPAGNVYFTGYLDAPADFGGGPIDAPGFITKLDASGNHLWSFGFDGQPTGLSIDKTGDVVLTGHFWGVLDFGGAPLDAGASSDVFVAKLDGEGNHLWSKQYGDDEHQSGYALATDSAGNVIVAAAVIGSIDFGGGPLSGNDVHLAVAKLDPGGEHIWSKLFGESGLTVALGVAIGPADEVVVAGQFSGSVDFGGGPLFSTLEWQSPSPSDDAFVAKLDAEGEYLWAKRFGDEGAAQVADTGGQSVRGVSIDDAGRIALVGWFERSVDFGGGVLEAPLGWEDAYLAVLDGDGNHVASQWFGSVYEDWGQALAFNGAGEIVVTGYYGNDLDLGCGPLPPATSRDVFLGALRVP